MFLQHPGHIGSEYRVVCSCCWSCLAGILIRFCGGGRPRSYLNLCPKAQSFNDMSCLLVGHMEMRRGSRTKRLGYGYYSGWLGSYVRSLLVTWMATSLTKCRQSVESWLVDWLVGVVTVCWKTIASLQPTSTSNCIITNKYITVSENICKSG